MFLAGPKIKNLHASKLASDFQPFDPGIMTLPLNCNVFSRFSHYFLFGFARRGRVRVLGSFLQNASALQIFYNFHIDN